MSESGVAMPLSVALTYVHMNIESGDYETAKSILRTMIRQSAALEGEGSGEAPSAADQIECSDSEDV
jgi:hypothetical protein